MSYAVIACPTCRKAWAVDLRGATATCPACATKTELAQRTRLWQGDSPQEAQSAVAALRLTPQAAQAVRRLAERPAHAVPRHDSAVDAAAAKGAGIRNKSERAEAVAESLTRLVGLIPHADLLAALERSGLDGPRAEAEVVRMLAADLMMEPRAGLFKFLAAT